jgi:hypothetical protein
MLQRQPEKILVWEISELVGTKAMLFCLQIYVISQRSRVSSLVQCYRLFIKHSILSCLYLFHENTGTSRQADCSKIEGASCQPYL